MRRGRYEGDEGRSRRLRPRKGKENELKGAFTGYFMGSNWGEMEQRLGGDEWV